MSSTSTEGSAASAVFDLDGTVTRGDTYVAFLLHVLRRRRGRAMRLPALAVQAARFKLGWLGNDALKARFLGEIAGGMRREDLAAWLPAFVEGQVAAVKPAARERIAWHRARGHRLVLASASLDAYAVPLGEALGFDAVVATRVKWRDGAVAGGLDGANLRGAAKLDALAAAGVAAPDYAYSDHHSDLPLLRAARHPVAVDPTAKLAALAEGSIPVERWA